MRKKIQQDINELLFRVKMIFEMIAFRSTNVDNFRSVDDF